MLLLASLQPICCIIPEIFDASTCFLATNLLHNARDIRCFYLLPCNQFSTWKRRTKLCGNLLLPCCSTFVMVSFVGKYENYKSCPMHFCASSHHFRDINISNFLSSESRSRSWSTISTLKPYNGNY